VESDGVLDTYFFTGDPVPDYPTAEFFGAYFGEEVSSNGFITDKRTNTEAATVGFDLAFWSNRGGSLEAIYPEGSDMLPGTTLTGGGFLEAVNGDGWLCIMVDLDIQEQELYSEGMYGIPLKIAESGGTAPGTNSAFGYVDLAESVLADNGWCAVSHYLFHDSETNSSNDEGIWVNRDGTQLELDLRKGDPVPGRPDRVIQDFVHMYINASGRLAIIGQADDNQPVLWLQDDQGDYQLIAKGIDVGHEFDVFGDGSDLRLILNVLTMEQNGSTGDALRDVINDDGDIVFRLKFIDSSEGVFTTTVVDACPGDFDGDGLRNFADFTTFSGAYGTAIGDPNYDPDADFNGDGLVNFNDFTTFSGYYGVPCP
jgi:hypothetical protein